MKRVNQYGRKQRPTIMAIQIASRGRRAIVQDIATHKIHELDPMQSLLRSIDREKGINEYELRESNR